MRRKTWLPGASFALVFTLLSACGGGGSSNDADKFVGTWTFAAGSAINATCMAPFPTNPPPFDLAGLQVTITRIDGSNVRIQAGGPDCSVNFKVSGSTASANPNQLCTLTIMLGGQNTRQAVMIQSWTLTLAGANIDTSLMGTVAVCTAAGTGVLEPTAPSDGGSSGGDAASGG